MNTWKARLRRSGAAAFVVSLLGAALFSTTEAQSGFGPQIICREVADMSIMFKPGTSEIEIAQVLSRVAIARGGVEYQLGGRWSTTARGSTGAQGNPVTLGWSYVPDGVTVPNEGLGTGQNSLTARMNTLFGNNTALWKSKFTACFNRWDALSGLSYVEEPDTGSPLHSSPGAIGVRGDARISLIPLTNNNVLAYNFYPSSGGDMVLNSTFNWASSSGDYRLLRNVVMHEHGHGIGLAHVESNNTAQLMEPSINTTFDGPQHDDIQGGQRYYGDNDENNDTAATRKDLGTATNGQTRQNLSLDDNADVDWYRIIVPAGMYLAVTASPVGLTYNQGPQGGAQAARNSLAINNIQLAAYESNGTTVIVPTQNTGAIGTPEVLSNIVPPANGEVYLRVSSSTSTDDIQLYQLTLNLTVAGPALSSISLSTSTTTSGEIVGGTVTLTEAAGAGGIDVTLSSSNTNAATVPASVNVPQGSTTAPFNVTALAVASPTLVTITGAYLGTQRTADLTINPAPVFVSPNSVTVGPGTVVSGGLPEFQASDDLRWVARPGSVLVSTQAPLVITLGGTTTIISPTQLEFGIEASATASNLNRTIELLDWFVGLYETIASSTEATTDVLSTYLFTVDAYRFVHPDGSLQARISYKATGPTLVYPWQVRVDRVYWKLWP